MSLDQNWFTETAKGHAFGLEIKQKLHEEQSPFQKIAIYETTTFGRLMTLDGLAMLTSRDNFVYHEMMAHPVLFSHPNPKYIAIVGGGDCGTLKEVLKHDTISQVTQIELDERVTRVSEQYFPELCDSNDDPRADFLFKDAVEWMKQAESESLDVIILDTTDPVGQAKRLFACEFYSDCRRLLRQGGFVVAQSESPLIDLDLLVDIRSEMGKAGYHEIQTIQFPAVTYPTGWWTATIARNGKKFGDFREQMAKHKPFPTHYYNADIHRACAALPQFVIDAFQS